MLACYAVWTAGNRGEVQAARFPNCDNRKGDSGVSITGQVTASDSEDNTDRSNLSMKHTRTRMRIVVGGLDIEVCGIQSMA